MRVLLELPAGAVAGALLVASLALAAIAARRRRRPPSARMVDALARTARRRVAR